MSQLATTVHVHDDDGNTHIFGPGDDVPAEFAEKITNPKAWASDAPKGKKTEAPVDPATAKAADEAKAAAKAAKKAAKAAEKSQAEVADTVQPSLTIPSKVSGSTVAWAAYAKEAIAAKGLQIEIADDAKRGEIITALDDAGIATA